MLKQLGVVRVGNIGGGTHNTGIEVEENDLEKNGIDKNNIGDSRSKRRRVIKVKAERMRCQNRWL